MKRILITGKDSYIGTHLESLLAKEPDKYAVTVLDVRTDDWRTFDFSGFDVIYHCAALVHKNEKNYTQEDYTRVNTELPLAIAEKAIASGVPQFIFMSTMAVYGLEGKVGSDIVIDKNTPVNPVTYYAKSKLSAEKKLEVLKDLSVCRLRPPMVYGPGCPGNYTVLKNFVLKYKVFPTLVNRRSMIHVDTLTAFIKLCIDEERTGLFHPQDPEPHASLDIAREVASDAGLRLHESRLLTLGIRLAAPFVGKLNKVWGNLTYAKDIDL